MTAAPRKTTTAKATDTLAQPSNDGAATIVLAAPLTVTFTLEGVCALLFHRWSTESVAAKAAAAKNSVAKKTDDVESYVYRDDSRQLCIPGEYVRMSIIQAARYRQDPRSPRKSA
jgi:hypothetical protein